MTHTLLRIDASARHEGSESRALTQRIVDRLSPATVITRDLTVGVPLIDAEWLAAGWTPEDQRTDAQRNTLALSTALIDELKAADTLVIGAPIYNFSIPASLKAWIDQIARAGGYVSLYRKRARWPVDRQARDYRGCIGWHTGWI